MAIADGALTGRGDVALVRRMAQGDPDAARVVYETHCDPLLRFIVRRFHGTREDAEEIVNDTFLSALDLGETFDGSCTLLSWLCSLARNRIIDHHRRIGAAKRIPESRLVRIDSETRAKLRQIRDPSKSVTELVEQLDRVRVVQALLNTLTPDQKEAIVLRYVEGFSVSEISKVMNRTERSIERLLDKAKEKPRREMVKWLGNESFRMLCMELLVL